LTVQINAGLKKPEDTPISYKNFIDFSEIKDPTFYEAHGELTPLLIYLNEEAGRGVPLNLKEFSYDNLEDLIMTYYSLYKEMAKIEPVANPPDSI
jgi:hypothetical protein